MNFEIFKLAVLAVLILDAVAANLMAWFGGKWWTKNVGIFARYFPMAKGWAGWYLILVIWIGFLTIG